MYEYGNDNNIGWIDYESVGGEWMNDNNEEEEDEDGDYCIDVSYYFVSSVYSSSLIISLYFSLISSFLFSSFYFNIIASLLSFSFFILI